MIDLAVNLPGLSLKNPVMPSSGDFGFDRHFDGNFDLNKLGAITMKATTEEVRHGNSAPIMTDTPAGMLNAIGLRNPGVKQMIEKDIPFLASKNVPLVANIAGSSLEEYARVAALLSQTGSISALELNISCPNVTDGTQFGEDPELAARLTDHVKACSDLPIYVKLSPNTEKMIEVAQAAEKAGAAGLSMINTLTGMKINLNERKPALANQTGGLSGAAIKPIAIRLIHEVSQHVSIPIIGMGGIRRAEDVLEFLLAGASAAAIGTANLDNPYICPGIIHDLPCVLEQYGFQSVKEAIGKGHSK